MDWDDPTQLPNGVAIVAQNVQYQAESVRTRDGFRHTMSYGLPGEGYGDLGYGDGGYGDSFVTGLDVLRVLNADVSWASVIFTSDGHLLTEDPPGSGTLVSIAASSILGSIPFPANASMLTAKAFNRIYMTFSDLKTGMGIPAVLDGPSGNVSPISQNPIGMPWTPDLYAQVGDLVKPPSAGGRWFRCITPGIMQPQEPTWPLLDGYFTVVNGTEVFNPPMATDGVTQWEEWTPAAPSQIPLPQIPVSVTDNPGGGTIAAGNDIYVRLSFIHPNVSSTPWQQAVTFLNTGANDAITLQFQNSSDVPYFGQGGPRVPRWMSQVVLHPEVFQTSIQLQVWVASVAHGNPPPTQYGLFATVDIDAPVVITSVPVATQAAPSADTAAPILLTVFKGESGIRQMIIVRYDQNGQPSPVDPGSPIPISFTSHGPIPVAFLPPGAGNDGLDTAAFTVAGQGPAGPYLFLDEPDPLQPFATGIQSISRTGGTTTAVVNDASGLAAGDVVFLADNVVVRPAIRLLDSPNGAVTTDRVIILNPPDPPFFHGSTTIFYTTATYGTKTPHGLSVNDKVTISGVANGIFNLSGTVLAVIDATHFKVSLFSSSFAQSGGGSATPTSGAAFDTSFVGEFTLATVDLISNQVTWAQVGQPNAAPVGPFPTVTIFLQQTLPTQAQAGTVAIPLNFDDTSLASATQNDVTEQLNCIVLPPCIDIAYLPSTQRMVYTSDQEPAGLIFSEENFPGVIDGENAILTIDISNGGIVVGARETRNGQIVGFKSNGGYAITPSGDNPAEWGVTRLWGERGPASGRAIASSRGGSAAESFLIFADPENGLHRYPGTNTPLDWLSQELKSRRPGQLSTWDRVNRQAAEQIWVVIDEDQKEIKVGVPLDGATSPSHILTMSYGNGWDPPLMMTMTGEWIESRTSRRWSLDPIPTYCAQAVDRTLQTPVDPRVDTRQILFGMAGGTGGNFVDFQVPNVYDDNGVGIDSRYRPAFAKDPAGRRLLFVGFTGRGMGKGQMLVKPISGDPDFDPYISQKSIAMGDGTKVVDFASSLKIPKPRLALEFSNGSVPGAWFALHEVVKYYRPIGVAAK